MLTQQEYEIISDEEGVRYFAYDDATGLPIKPGTTVQGNVTIGIGRNLTGEGITAAECMMFLDDDWSALETSLAKLDWFEAMGQARQFVILDMAFQMGLSGLEAFEQMIVHLKDGDYQDASNDMLASKWAEETPERAHALAAIMASGELPAASAAAIAPKPMVVVATLPTGGNTPKHGPKNVGTAAASAETA